MGAPLTDEDCVRTKKKEDCTIRMDDQQKLLISERCIDLDSQVYLEFSQLSYTVPGCKVKEKNILRGVSGHFRPGKLTGIIGPSGAGKTSLLSILSGLRGSNVKGSITVNGNPRNADEFRRSACYIPQEFALLPRLTTRETLCIAARLKLGHPHTAQSRELVMKEVASKLGLMNCMDTMADQLSGGEKKRLSIGVEIVTNPAVMLLDEPTSGLDSLASNQVVGLMKNIAKSGCTVVCAIHQPNSQMIEQFDDILVLAGGRNFYCGPREEIVETFLQAKFACPAFYNIAEFVIEVVTGQREGDLERLCEIGNSKCRDSKLRHRFPRRLNGVADVVDSSNPKSSTCSENWTEKMPGNESSPVMTWDKQMVLFYRAIICIRRDNTMTKLRLVAHIIVALLLGLVFYNFGNDSAKIQSNVACLFFFLLFLFFANSMPAVQMFPVEAAVFLREHLNNWYGLSSYYIAKVVTDVPLQIVCPTCFLVIAYFMTGQPLECERFVRVWLICVLITVVAQSLGIVTGAAFDTHAGCFLVPALNIPMFLFAGFFLKLNEVPSYLRFFSSVSYFRYAFEGILQSIYGNNRTGMECSEDFCPIRKPEKVLSMMDMPTTSFWLIVVALVVWILCLHVTIYSVLRWKLYRLTK
ncbi:ATP-binding cassette sub-family G member 4-like [Venturia canescens]|uniref:ATP-binding cassette sub-family G member 4-like n=1 Tax=Venturia canescens TaxID=32260 RepID=UPI001C9C555F|nr:ATP-binding cassette sub-family G member 4-like [Venturia canescens]